MRVLYFLFISITMSTTAESSYGVIKQYKSAVAPLCHDETVMDTPEVMRLKAQHFAARSAMLAKIAQAQKETGEEEDDEEDDYNRKWDRTYESEEDSSSYSSLEEDSQNAPIKSVKSVAPFDRSGRVKDTPEVRKRRTIWRIKKISQKMRKVAAALTKLNVL